MTKFLNIYTLHIQELPVHGAFLLTYTKISSSNINCQLNSPIISSPLYCCNDKIQAFRYAEN